MSVLYFLESIRTPWLDELMLQLTRLGEEYMFLLVTMLVYWCVSKRRGYLIMAVCFTGSMICLLLKMIFAIPRPWVLDPDFTIVERARQAAEGYSFPSAHTQIAACTLGAIACTTRRRWVSAVCVILALLVGLSRMYLGVHAPRDVLVGYAIAAVLLVLLRPMADRWDQRQMTLVFLAALAVGLVLHLCMELIPFANVDGENMADILKNSYTMMGGLVGIAIAYPLERRYVRFDTHAVWWAQLIKVVVGMALLLAVKELFQAPLELLLPTYAARTVRYALIVIMGVVLWPMAFRLFPKPKAEA